MLNPEELKKNIDAYKYEQEVLKRLIRKRGELSEKKFDLLFLNRSVRRPKVRFCGMTEHSVILGNLSLDDWSKWLHLLQIMVAMRSIDVGTDKDGVFYTINRESEKPTKE